MITEKIKQLELAKIKVAELQKLVEREMKRELAGLPAKYGFVSLAGFVAAIKRASGKRFVRGERKTRARAVITEETRAQVKKLVIEGKTGAQIASNLKISLPSVQNIKKALGLVRPKKT